MLRRPSDPEIEAIMISKIVEAIYPVLIPVEEQDMAIQAKNHAHINSVARITWKAFIELPRDSAAQS